MKRFLISFVLIFALLFNVFANNKKAHNELRKVFENYGLYNELKARGFDLKKLDKIDDWEEMRDYLQPFFIDENGMPLDNHVWIEFNLFYGTYGNYKIKTQSTMHIDWSDEYGSKDELLNKGYKEDEIFYYPYFNGEWRDGYRVGKKYMGDCKDGGFKSNYSISSEKALLVGFRNFDIENNNKIYDEISKSNKDYLILDLSYNCGGMQNAYDCLVEAVSKMKPKEVYIMISNNSASMAEYCSLHLEKESGIKTILVGHPSVGAYAACVSSYNITFDKFSISGNLGPKANYAIPNLVEGIGITPNYYANTSNESLEVIKHLINDKELVLPNYVYY